MILTCLSGYRRKAHVYNESVEEFNAATQESDDLKQQYEGLRKKRLDEFMAEFNIISLKLKEMHQVLLIRRPYPLFLQKCVHHGTLCQRLNKRCTLCYHKVDVPLEDVHLSDEYWNNMELHGK
ncbi:structural maintenance of chromosomes protein 4 [Iris pallida]|uniref:Structural maintenance of chromosomes protein 4 n=1 Tax=Iris pallida TaxID=29817 RepID=A0AAX6FCN2_IRIPA|nr:structural maintenance of chromosomes protein 4 [Iris pallida]